MKLGTESDYKNPYLKLMIIWLISRLIFFTIISKTRAQCSVHSRCSINTYYHGNSDQLCKSQKVKTAKKGTKGSITLFPHSVKTSENLESLKAWW